MSDGLCCCCGKSHVAVSVAVVVSDAVSVAASDVVAASVALG